MNNCILQYHCEKKAWRANTDLDDNVNFDREWSNVAICEYDLALSFIATMEEVQKESTLLHFRNIDNIRMLLKVHSVQFLAKKKQREYLAAEKNILVQY